MMAMTTSNSIKVKALSAGLANLGMFITSARLNPRGQSFQALKPSVFIAYKIKDCKQIFKIFFVTIFNDRFRIFAFAIEKTPILRIMPTPCGCAIHNFTTDVSFMPDWLWSRWSCICQPATMVLLHMMTSNM
jgi:hypothetical protein